MSPAMLRCIAILCLLPAALCPAQETATPPARQRVSYDEAVKLSPLAHRLATCGEDTAGIRARLQLVLEEMKRDPQLYKVDGLPAPDLSLIPIQVEVGDGRHTGGTQWAASNLIVRYRMRFFTAALPAATDEDSRLMREMLLNDTLVHELAHCFFYMRYPKLGLQEDGEGLTICEGHAICAAREFVQRHYFGGATMPDAYYEQVFLSTRYAAMYREFRTRYLSPQRHMLWQLIDRMELRFAPAGYTLRLRRQI